MTHRRLVLKRDRLMGIGQAITMPLFFASNALYPVAIMPGWLQVAQPRQPAELRGGGAARAAHRHADELLARLRRAGRRRGRRHLRGRGRHRPASPVPCAGRVISRPPGGRCGEDGRMDSEPRVQVPAASGTPVPGAEVLGPVDPAERAEVTVVLRRRTPLVAGAPEPDRAGRAARRRPGRRGTGPVRGRGRRRRGGRGRRGVPAGPGGRRDRRR